MAKSSPRDPNYVPAIQGVDTVSGNAQYLSSLSLGGSTVFPLTVAVVDGSGTQITSFGGGTQYIDGNAAVTHPTGTGVIFNAGGIYEFVSTTQPLPITIISGNPTSIAVTQSTSPWIVAGGGTAGSAASDVITVQGIASMTPVQVSQTTASNLNATVVGTGTFAVQAAQSGTWTASLQTATSGGWTPSSQTALTNTKVAVKASAGQLGGYMFYNPNTSVSYIQVFNVASASVTLGSTTPTYVLSFPAGSAANIEFTQGIEHSTAITAAATTTPTGSTAPSSSLVGFFLFK